MLVLLGNGYAWQASKSVLGLWDMEWFRFHYPAMGIVGFGI